MNAVETHFLNHCTQKYLGLELRIQDYKKKSNFHEYLLYKT